MSRSALPPILWLCLLLLLPRANMQPRVADDTVRLDYQIELAPTFSARNRVHPELPTALILEVIKETERPEDGELTAEISRIEPSLWSESTLLARQSSYLGHSFRAPTPPTKRSDRLRC